jgi:hypothetical protein
MSAGRIRVGVGALGCGGSYFFMNRCMKRNDLDCDAAGGNNQQVERQGKGP